MKNRDHIIIGLITLGILLFAVVQGVIIPQNNMRRQQYLKEQQDPITHDINRVLPFHSKYMGNASNIGNLFANLPLSAVPRTYQLHPDAFTVEVNYKELVSTIGAEKVSRALIYNAAAAFALIDNLQGLRYNFMDLSYKTTRSQVEDVFGKDLSGLLTKEKWKMEVQDKLKDDIFVESSMQKIFAK